MNPTRSSPEHPADSPGGAAREPGPSPACWHLLTGEYPPVLGGVADYTWLVAADLAASGQEVHVWTTPAEGETPRADGVMVHRVAGRWSPADLASLDRALDGFTPPRRLLVQYTPNAWGYRGINLGFCRWLCRRVAMGDDVWTMIHEGYYHFHFPDRPQRWALSIAHRLMMRDLLKASSHVYCSMPYWQKRLRPYDTRRDRPIVWLPVPSNIPVVDDPAAAAETRRRLAPGGETIIGNFGTFAVDFRRLLHQVLPPLLADRADRVGVLIGRNSADFAEELLRSHPGLAGRLVATGGLDARAASLHLQACDVLAQPYEYGVSTRRGTIMAGLSHGRPIATTFGPATEPIWNESGCVVGVEVADLAALPAAVERLLADPEPRAALAARARAVYDDRFTVGRTVEVLLRDAASPRPGVESANPAETGIALKG
jgi:glycosyltransferase involved in cell wall biosynthesis